MAGKEQSQQKPNLEEITKCPNHPKGHYMNYCCYFKRDCEECTENTVLIDGKEYTKCEIWEYGNRSVGI